MSSAFMYSSPSKWVSLNPKKRIIQSLLHYLNRYQESDEKWLVAKIGDCSNITARAARVQGALQEFYAFYH